MSNKYYYHSIKPATEISILVYVSGNRTSQTATAKIHGDHSGILYAPDFIWSRPTYPIAQTFGRMSAAVPFTVHTGKQEKS